MVAYLEAQSAQSLIAAPSIQIESGGAVCTGGAVLQLPTLSPFLSLFSAPTISTLTTTPLIAPPSPFVWHPQGSSSAVWCDLGGAIFPTPNPTDPLRNSQATKTKRLSVAKRHPLRSLDLQKAAEKKESEGPNSALQATSLGEKKFTANYLLKFASDHTWNQESDSLKHFDWKALQAQAKNHELDVPTPQMDPQSVAVNPQQNLDSAAEAKSSADGAVAAAASGSVGDAAAAGSSSETPPLDLVKTQREVERILKDYGGSFSIQIVPADDKRFLPILDVEGCPKCLRGVDENDGPKVILRCLTQRCSHVIHLSCVLKPSPADNPEAPEGATNWQEATLKSFHCSSYFALRALAKNDPDLHPDLRQNMPGSRRNCLMALEISHLLSNATALRVNWENALASLLDPQTGREYLLLSLDKLAENESPPVFRAQRGRVVFKCQDVAHNAVWHHDCNYDISKQVGGDLAKLVYTDRDSQNTLTLGVQKQRVPRDGTTGTGDDDLVDAITLLYVKYEFSPQQMLNSPMFGPLYPYASPMQQPGAASRPGNQLSPMASPMPAPPMLTPNGHYVFPVPLSPPPLAGREQPNSMVSPLLSPMMSQHPGGRKMSYPGGGMFPPGAAISGGGYDPLAAASLDGSRGGGMLPLLPMNGPGTTKSPPLSNGSGMEDFDANNDSRLNLMTLTQAQQSAAALLATNPNSAATSVANTPRGSITMPGGIPQTSMLPGAMAGLPFPPPSPLLPNGAFPHGGMALPGLLPPATPGGGLNLLPPAQGRRSNEGQPRASHAHTNGGGAVPLSPEFARPPGGGPQQLQWAREQMVGRPGEHPYANGQQLLAMQQQQGNGMRGLTTQLASMSLHSSNGNAMMGGRGGVDHMRGRGGFEAGFNRSRGGATPQSGRGGPSRPPSAGNQPGAAPGSSVGSGPSSQPGATPQSQPGAQTPNGSQLAGTSIDHVIGRVYHLSKTQSGSRFVQEKLSDAAYFPIFFNELKTRVADLMMDCFGHYAIEALLGMCDREQLLILLVNLSNRITEVACHKQGSFSIQFMMDCLTTQTQIGLLADALYPDVDEVMLNCSGHYVILRFLQRYSYPYTKFIHKAIVEHTVKLATDHYGLRVLKSAVDAGPAAQMQEVFSSLIKCTNTLVENQYGNYIVQHLLEVAPKPVGIQLKQKMNGKYVRFSKQKFSSNVVEKCLRNSNREWRYTIIRQLISAAGELISDKYGNYCLQTALSVADRQLVHEFTQAVYPHLSSLRENIKAKWKKILENAHAKHSTAAPPVAQNTHLDPTLLMGGDTPLHMR